MGQSKVQGSSRGPRTSPGLMLLEGSDEEEERGERKSAASAGLAVPTSPIVAKNPVPQTMSLNLAGFTLAQVTAACEGSSKKDGGLNKGDIVKVLAANGVGTSGKRSELEARLGSHLEAAPQKNDDPSAKETFDKIVALESAANLSERARGESVDGILAQREGEAKKE